MELENKGVGIGHEHSVSKFKRSTSVFAIKNELSFKEQKESVEFRFVHINGNIFSISAYLVWKTMNSIKRHYE